MLRLTLAQMRRSLGRLTAAGIAIAIGTAFVAATLVAGAVMTRTTQDAVTASLADADLVVLARGEDSLTDDDVARLAEVPGVEAVDGRAQLWLQLSSPSADVYPEATVRASHPRLEVQELVEGTWPDGPGGVAVPVPLAERLRVEVGDTVTTVRDVWTPDEAATDPDAAGTWTSTSEELVVTGLTEDPTGGFTGSGGAVVVDPADARRWLADESLGAGPGYRTVVVVATEGAELTEVATSLREVSGNALVRTKDEHAAALVNELSGGEDALTAVVLAFAAVALLVAALVIANTFQVLVAQRTRTLALLRCVGADRAQVRRSVLLEAAILGVGASVVGVLGGLALSQATLSVVGATGVEVPLPDVITVTPAAVLVPLAVGTAVTLAAALAPARAATRVAPLAALRPADPVEGRRAGRVRLTLATLLAVGGGLLLAAGALAAPAVGPLVALGVGVLGGAVSFVGILLGAVVWVPAVTRGVGGLLGRAGPTARLAAANTVRNPRRTAATSSALLIGVTLVAMMSTGAASARTTLADELAAQYPVDLAVAVGAQPDERLDPAVLTTLEAVDGVGQVTPVASGEVELRNAGAEPLGRWTVLAAAPDELGAVLRAPQEAAALADDTVVIGEDLARSLGVEDGKVLTVHRASDGDGEAAADTPTGAATDEATVGTAATVRAVVTDLPGVALVTPATLAAAVEAPVTGEAWVRFDDDAPADRVVADVQEALSDTPVMVSGAALERVRYEQVVDTLLAVVVGLLGAAVVIAVIGVANTLSLSVLERRRESATLRALGLTRGRLRGTLAIEGVLIAGIGAAVGAVLGLLYGWAGAAAVLGAVGTVTYEVPWRDLAVVLVVAVLAGLLASVLPGRAAARTSPVRALAVE
jgi:putative ABC transport system permease protein